MKMIKSKRTVSFIVCFVFVFTCLSIPAYAGTQDEDFKEQGVSVLSESTKADRLAESEVMDFPEMIVHYAAFKDMSYANAVNNFPADVKQRFLDGTTGYVAKSIELNVTDEYKPTIDCYCEVEALENGSYRITSIYHVELVRGYGKELKDFAGTLKVWLREANGIECSINGDFCNDGSLSVNSAITKTLAVGDSAMINFNTPVSGTNYKYFYEHKTEYFS